MPSKEWRKRNPEKQKELARIARKKRWERIKNDPELKANANARMRAWYSVPENKAKAIARHSKNWRENPEIRRRKHSQNLQAWYGITIEQKEAMLAAQGGACAICTEVSHGDVFSWHVDHDHQSGHVRGILCMLCNLLLGKAKDRPEVLRAAADYLEKRK